MITAVGSLFDRIKLEHLRFKNSRSSDGVEGMGLREMFSARLRLHSESSREHENKNCNAEVALQSSVSRL
jgi:hypothetical protein